jgi:ABC-type dipeptide/oligopeptide/nickel transport system permease component
VYALRRLLALIPILLGVSVITFLSIHLTPGDPVNQILATNANKEAADRLREKLGLNDPLPVQYVRWLGSALHGDFGRSLLTNAPVSREILDRFPSTLQLAIAAMLIAVVLGIPLGMAAAVTKRSELDSGFMMVALVGLSTPTFWLGMLLSLFFGVRLHWFPILGGSGYRSLVLPAFTLGIVNVAIVARLTRSSMLDVLRQEYMTTARAKGLRERTVIVRHACRNSLIPVLTVLGIQFGDLLAGTVIVEAVFARAGLGTLAIRAIQARDFPLIQGIVLFYAVLYVGSSLIVDLLYGVLDPRIRFSGR